MRHRSALIKHLQMTVAQTQMQTLIFTLANTRADKNVFQFCVFDLIPFVSCHVSNSVLTADLKCLLSVDLSIKL